CCMALVCSMVPLSPPQPSPTMGVLVTWTTSSKARLPRSGILQWPWAQCSTCRKTVGSQAMQMVWYDIGVLDGAPQSSTAFTHHGSSAHLAHVFQGQAAQEWHFAVALGPVLHMQKDCWEPGH